MRARSVGILVVIVLLFAGLVRPAFAAASCTTYDAQNLPTSTFGAGEKIIIRGTGFGPNARVLISLQQGTRTIELAGANANDLGAFASTDGVIPATVSEGDGAIRAIDARGSATCQITLEAGAKEGGEGVPGLFWVWGALLALFAIVLGVLTYRRWKTERLKEAVDSLAWRDQYDERTGERIEVSPDRPPVVGGRPERLTKAAKRDRGLLRDEAFDGPFDQPFDRPDHLDRPGAEVPRSPQAFEPVRQPARGGFDESIRTTAPFPPDPDEGPPLGAPLPFDDRFATNEDHASYAPRRQTSPDRDEAVWRTQRPPPAPPPPEGLPLSSPFADDAFDDLRGGGDDRSYTSDPAPTREAAVEEPGPVGSFHVSDVLEAIEQDEAPMDERAEQHTFEPRVERPVPERPVPERPVPERPVPERPVPERPVPERPVPERPVLEVQPPFPEVQRPVSDDPPPAVRRPTAAIEPAAHDAEKSFAQALRAFLDAEELQLDTSSDTGSARPESTGFERPDDASEPPLLDRPFERSQRSIADVSPVAPAAPPVEPAASPVEPFRDAGPAAPVVPAAHAAPAYHPPEPRRPGPPATDDPLDPYMPAAQHQRDDLPPTPAEPPPVPPLAPPSEPDWLDEREPEPLEPEPEAYLPSPRPAERDKPRRPDPSEAVEPAWEPPLRPVDPEPEPAPPHSVAPRGPVRPPVPARPTASDADVEEPPVLPVGWDDGRLRPSHKRSSDSIERLRREVRDWKR